MAITFKSEIKNNDPEYWRDKPNHEASNRVVFPYRHKTAHEARIYTPFEMERVVYYMFASIVFMNLGS